MKYFIIEGSFVENHPTGATLEKAIKAHTDYLQTGLDSGTILFAGPKARIGGGFIVVKYENEQGAQSLCDNDPMFKSGIQTYKITEFFLHDCQGPLRYWFG